MHVFVWMLVILFVVCVAKRGIESHVARLAGDASRM
jgi:hypothetical protein